MTCLNNEKLNDVNLILERVDVNDRFIEAKIELFEYTEKLKKKKRVGRTEIGSGIGIESGSGRVSTVATTVAVGTKKHVTNIIGKKCAKHILINIINILNYVFPDYEFKHLKNTNYQYIKNINKAFDNINYNLFYLIEKLYKGFNRKIWKLLKELIDFKHCDVYTYLNNTDYDPYVDINSISSFNYFFFAKKNKRILFISCITKPKYKTYNDDDFNNVYIELQDELSGSKNDTSEDAESSSSN